MSSIVWVIAGAFGILLLAAVGMAAAASVAGLFSSALGGMLQGWATGFAVLAALVILVPLIVYILLKG